MNPASLSSLTVREIVAALPIGTFSCAEQRCRRKLETAIPLLPSDYFSILSALAMAKPQGNRSVLESNNLLLANPTLYHSVRSLSMKEIVDALPPEMISWGERRWLGSNLNPAPYFMTMTRTYYIALFIVPNALLRIYQRINNVFAMEKLPQSKCSVIFHYTTSQIQLVNGHTLAIPSNMPKSSKVSGDAVDI